MFVTDKIKKKKKKMEKINLLFFLFFFIILISNCDTIKELKKEIKQKINKKYNIELLSDSKRFNNNVWIHILIQQQRQADERRRREEREREANKPKAHNRLSKTEKYKPVLKKLDVRNFK
jgi:hypothetical protein